MAALHDAYRATQTGRAVVVLLHGNSGMGKTTLVRHFFEDMRRKEPQALLLGGRCYEQESVPYKGFDSLMDALCRHLQKLLDVELERILPRDVMALAKVFPVLMQVSGVGEGRRVMGYRTHRSCGAARSPRSANWWLGWRTKDP